jgi:hypothetical protein
MNLDQIVESIIHNSSIHDLLTDILAGREAHEHPFRKLVEYQRDIYAREGLYMAKEGFQVGEPWNGDIKNARVAFISSNPAFNPYEDFPRYHHANPEAFSMPDGRPLAATGVKDFFERRFENAHITDSGVLQVKCLNQNTGKSYHNAVPYWGCVRNSIETLWPNAALPGDSINAYVKRLMSKAVSMELVPFKSSAETGVVGALPTCLRNFTRHILPHIAAPIIVLVGKKVRRGFMDFAITNEVEWGKAKQAFDSGAVYHYEKDKDQGSIFSGDKFIVSVGFNVGGFSLSSSCPPSTIQELQAVFASGIN